MIQMKLDTSYLRGFLNNGELEALEGEVFRHRKALLEKSGAGNDFLGWTGLPSGTSFAETAMLNTLAGRMAEIADTVVVIGIGGSYLGARAIIEALQDPFYRKKEGSPEVVYAGHHLSGDYLAGLLEYLESRQPALLVISKSGTTTEPAIAFRMLRAYMEDRFGQDEARKRIIAITDRERGALRGLAGKEGYRTFVIPDDVGGRYSVLTPVGLLPIALAGWNIQGLLDGARNMEAQLRSASDLAQHPAGLYAAARHLLYRKGKNIEVLVNYEPSLSWFSEWWKQLYGESEGKEGKGIFPASVSFTSDLHSMGQYLQEGERSLFETVLSVGSPRRQQWVPADPQNTDGLNFLAGMSLSDINRKAEEGTLLAHVDGGVPNLRIEIPRIDEESLGELIYFFEMGCAISGYMLGVNPFDQPGVEAYKRNMFALLGKPGYEEEGRKLQERLK